MLGRHHLLFSRTMVQKVFSRFFQVYPDNAFCPTSIEINLNLTQVANYFYKQRVNMKMFVLIITNEP